MSVASNEKWTWGLVLFAVFGIASGVLIYLVQEQTWTGFFPICFAIGSCLGALAGMVVYAVGAADSCDHDDLLKSGAMGFGTWVLSTLLLPIAVIVLGIAAFIWLASQSDGGSKPKKYRKIGEIYEEER